MKTTFSRTFKELEKAIKENPKQNIFVLDEGEKSKYKFHIHKLLK